MDVFETIKEEAKQLSYSSGCHDFGHSERVYALCMQIGKNERANLEVLKYASILHDIGRKKEDESNGAICHAEYSAKMAKSILERHAFPQGFINDTLHCIEAHRFRTDKKPETIEARVLYDADKLDAIGAIGIARAYVFAGQVGAKVHDTEVDPEKTSTYSNEDTGYREYLAKLCKIKDKMLTATGKQIAENRDNFMKEFFNQINKEVRGEL